jgi:hypothetical protein
LPDPSPPDDFHRISIEDGEDLFSLKRALWANQTLQIKILEESKRTNGYLAGIKYWIQSGVIFLLIAALLHWWTK